MTRRMRVALWLVAVLLCAAVRADEDAALVLTLAARTGGLLRVAWTLAPSWLNEHANDTITGFNVFLDGALVAQVAAATSEYELTGLANNTQYAVSVTGESVAENGTTALLGSDTLVASTLDVTQPATPPTPELLDAGGGFLRVRVALPRDTGGVAIANISVVVASQKDYMTTTSLSQAASQPEFTVYGLDARTPYRVSAYVVNAAELPSGQSDGLLANTSAVQLPGACPPPTVLNVTGGSFQLQLNPPIDDGGARIKGYVVYMAVNGSSVFEEVANTVASQQPNAIEIRRLPRPSNEPLRPLTSYDVKAVAVNMMDVCVLPASVWNVSGEVVSVVTDVASLPGAPPSPYFLSATGGEVTIQLLMPGNMRGAILTGFSVAVDGGAYGSLTTSEERSYSIAYLRTNSSYSVQVAVVTDVGASEWSAPIVVRTGNPSRPSPPLNVSAVSITPSQAFIQWQIPVDSGGVAITEYRLVLFTASGIRTISTQSTSQSYQLSGLLASTTYTVKIVAINEISLESSVTRANGATFQTLIATAPGIPFGISAVSRTGGAIEVAWHAPEESGGAGYDGIIYNISMVRVAPCYTNASTTSACGTCDLVRVPAGDEQYAYTRGCEQPSTASCPDGSASCCVTTSNNLIGGGHLCSRIGGLDHYRLVPGGATVSAFQRLNHSTTYFFGIQAINKAGTSRPSSIVGLRTSSQTAPSYPSDIRWIDGTGGSVKLTWAPPQDTGGTTIVGYRVYRDYELLTPQPVVPPYVDCGFDIKASTQYLYGIAAVNASQLEGSMGSLLVETPPVTPPQQIRSLWLESRAVSWLNVTVTRECDLGGSRAVSYQFQVTQDSAPVASGFFACCNIFVSGLLADREYQVSVRVANEAATLEWFNATFATTSGIPATTTMTLQRANSYSLDLSPATPYREIAAYEIEVSKDGNQIQGYSFPCKNATAGPGLRICPRILRVDGLSPNTSYEVSSRALGPRGSSEWNNQSFETTDGPQGVVEFESQSYAGRSGGAFNVTVQRVNGTAGNLNVLFNVSQPETVVVACDCFLGEGCSCRLYLASSLAVSKPGRVSFVDGQENQTIQVSVWEDDPSVIQPMEVVLGLIGSVDLIGNQSQAQVQISQSERSGFPAFTRSQLDVLENSSYAELNIVRLNGSSGTIAFDIETFDISSNASLQYIPLSRSVLMADRQSHATVWVRLIDSRYYEGTRVFGVRLRPRVTDKSVQQLAVSTRRVRIIDDEDSAMVLPGTPSNLSTVRVTGGEIELEWLGSNSNNAGASGFLVRVSTPSNGTDIVSMYNTSSSPSFILSALEPMTLYRFQVAAWNLYGVSEFSGTTLVLTTVPSPPSSPLRFRTTDVGSSYLRLAWEKPRDLGGLPLLGFRLSMQDDYGDYRLVAETPQGVTSYTMEGLSAMTTYTFFVAAGTTAFNVSSSSIAANLTVSTGEASIPTKPPPPNLMRQPTGGTLTFLIGDSQDLGGTFITDYSLFMRKVIVDSSGANPTANNFTNPSEESFQVVCSDATPWANISTSRSCTVYKLLRETSYEFYVVLHNVKGVSEPSDRVIYRTSSTIGLPSPPEKFQASKVTAGNIMLDWDLPLDLGGVSDVLGYTVFQRKDPFFSDSFFVLYDGQDSTERRVAIKGLARSTTYAFAVIAHNTASYCMNLAAQQMSNFIMVKTLQSSTLSPPQSLRLLRATGGTITIGWDAPDDLAGVPLQGYVVELISGDINSSSFMLTPDMLMGAITSYTHYGLDEQSEYRYAVTAVNQDGPGERSAIAVFSSTSATPPSTILDIRVEEVSGGRVVLTWSPPIDSGGRPILYYEVTRGDQPNNIRTVATTSFTDKNGLVAMTNYEYYIRAFNGLVLGGTSYMWSTTGPPTVSDPPILTEALSYGGRIEITWAIADDTGGVPVLEYNVTLFTSSGTAMLESYQGVLTNYTFSLLSANTPYMLELSAVNEVGEGLAIRYNVATGNVDLPSAPPPPNATEILGGSMVLTAYPPSYNGGEAVTLLIWNDTSVVVMFGPGQNSTLVSGLVALTQYRFRVSAKNSFGQTIGEDLFVSTGPISTPSAVTDVQLVEATYDRLSISWAPVQDAGGDLSLQYEITYFACDTTGVALPTSTATVVNTSMTRIVLTNLSDTTSYSVTVRPLTSSGIYGSSSEAVIFATEQPLVGRIIVQFADVVIQEGNLTVDIPLTRVNGSFDEATYSYQVHNETAIAGANFRVMGSTGAMASGVKSGMITIGLVDDKVYYPNVTFAVEVRDVQSNSITRTRVTILDNGDAGFISFASPEFRILENTGEASIPMTRNGGSSPVAIIQPYIHAMNTALVTRFTVVESAITFGEGSTLQYLTVLIQDDADFQYWPDTVVIKFNIVEGGVWAGEIVATNLTAVDDGDESPPKEVTGLSLVGATGGSLRLQWTPPVDQGAVSADLWYLVQLFSNGESFRNTTTSSTSTVIYALPEHTAYEVIVLSGNSAGAGKASSRLLATTTKATPPSAPLNVSLGAASSSTLLLMWDPPVDAGGTEIVGYTLYRVQTNGSVSPFPSVTCSLPTMCLIKGLLALTPYEVQVRAITAAFSTTGNLSASAVFQTSNPDVPDPPPLANVTWVSAGAMTIKMFSPVNIGGSEVEQYRLFMRGPSDLDIAMIYQGAADSYTIYRLDRRTSYEIKYQVINSVGASDFGPVLIYQTLERSVVSAPVNVTVISATGGAITLQWNEPLDVGGRAVLGYTVMLRSDSKNSSILGYDGRQNPDTRGIVYGLTATTTYLMYVVAYSEVSNCFSPTEWAASLPIEATTTPPTLPTPAPQVFLIRVTGGIVELMWKPPMDEGGVPITGYTVSLVSPTGMIMPIFSAGGNGPYSFIHNDLIESTVYTYIVNANSSVGDSNNSEPLVVKTLIATAPSAPLNVRQLQYVTGGAIQIGWDRPVDTGGQPLQAYWIYRDGAAITQNLDASAQSFVDTDNLRAATSYTYTLRAISWSTMGSELSSSISANTAAASKPQPPLLQSNATGASFFQISWAANPDAGGLSVSLFEAKLMHGSATIGSYVGKDTSFRFTRLAAATAYGFLLVSHNEVGESDPLSVNFTTLPAATPDAPPAPVAIAIFGGNITMEVTAPVDTGGVDITEMRVYDERLGYLGKVPFSAGALKAQFTAFGLVSTTVYNIMASAVNRLGEGRPSPRLTVRTGPINSPGAVSLAPNVTGATGTTLSVSWAAPVDSGGDENLVYEVRFVGPGGEVKSVKSATRSVTGTGLKYFTLYAITVRVINSASESAWSPPLSLRTLPDAAGDFNFDTTAVSVLENAGFITLNVQRTNGLSGVVTVFYYVSSSGANAATVESDFALVPASLKTNGTVTFASLQLSATITISILDDGLYESPDEQFTVVLASVKLNAMGVVRPPTIGVNASTIVSIIDDGDVGTISFSQANYIVREDAVTLSIPIVREGGNSTKIVLVFSFTDGTAIVDRDYRRPLLSTLTMGDGQTAEVLRVSIMNDRLYEFPDEFFTIAMTSASSGVRFKRNITRITIRDDGDHSPPAQPPAPTVLTATGGSVRLAMELPAHNGSVSSVLGSYLLRVLTPSVADALLNVTVPVSNIATVGGLIARTQYELSVAVSNTAGWSTFSPSIVFSTTAPTLPGPVLHVSQNGSTGGSVQLSWLPPDDSGGVPITKYRIYRLPQQGASELLSEILEPVLGGTVYGLTANTTYQFVIQAGNGVLFPEIANGWGRFGKPFEVTTPQATLPGPTLISKDAFAKATGGSISISWVPPLDTGGVPILSYDVLARNASTGYSIVTHIAEPASRSTVIDSLYASTWYEIFLVAVNNVRSTSIPGVVTCSIGSKTLTTTVDLSKTIASGAVLHVGETMFVIGNMTLATKGSIPLAVAHVGKSISKQAASMIGVATHFANLSTSAPTIPRVPPEATLLDATGGAITFRLDPPGDTGGVPMTKFTVLVDGEVPDSDSVLLHYETVSPLKKLLTMRVTNLSPQSSIEVIAIAINSISLCDFNEKAYSDPIVFETKSISAPEAPRIVQQYVTGGGMKLALVDPFDKGGAEIIRFLLYMTTNPSTSDWVLVANVSRKLGDVKRSSTVVARLKPLTKYHFRMSANNGAFESPNSTIAPISTSGISPPGTCEEPRLVAATGGTLTVEWDDPLDNGGAAIIDFTITIQPTRATGSAGKRVVRSWQPRNYTFYGLTDETEYSVFVRARNEKGSGADGQAAVFSTTKGTPPSGKIAVTVVSSTGGAVILTFNEPLDLGGTPPEDMVYRVFVDNVLAAIFTYGDLAKSEVLAPSSGRRRLAASSPVGVVVGGLDPLSLYNIQIQPVNGFATGDVSGGASATTTTATLPSAPRSLDIGDVGGGSVFLMWELPDDTGGLPLLDYVVYMGSTADGTFAEICRDTSTTCRVTGLSAATPYWFYVVSTNRLGASPATSTVSATTLSVSRPHIPGKITVVSVSESTLAIAWTAPADAGGSAITSYSVTVKNAATGVVATTEPSVATSATVTGLASATLYSLSVSAANQIATSDPSIARLVSTATAAKVPAGPFISCVSSTTVSLLWYPHPNGTQYRLFRNGDQIYAGTGTRYVDSVVSSSVMYEYRLEAEISGAWAGTRSTPLQVTTLDDISDEAKCSASEGFVSEMDYKPSTSKAWLLSPANPFSTLSLQFATLDLECDHDKVRIEQANDRTLLWQGGCTRVGTFVLHSTTAVRIRFTTDATVERRGFELLYETDRVSVADTKTPRIVPPRTSFTGAVCASRGVGLKDGTCKCSVGFTGEACSNHMVCCRDPSQCSHDVCSRDSSRVVTVSDEFGDDARGTGAMMDTSEMGSASKAVKTLSKGLSLVRDGGTIFVYPGVYKEAVNRELLLASRRDITIESLKGFAWTTIDCESKGRAVSISQSSLVIDGFTIRNGLAPSSGDGGAISVADSSLALRNVLITDSTAVGNGGAVAASRSNLTATRTRLEQSSALRGGAVSLVDSLLTLDQSNITQCKAENGGAVTLTGTSSIVGVDGSFLSKNVATGDGGCLLVERGVVSIQALRVSENDAVRGGAVAVWDNSKVVFDGCVINANKASADGGGFALSGSVVLLGNSMNVYENTATARGGGLFASGPQISVSSSSSDSPFVFSRNQADYGAGIAVVSSGLTLSGLSIERGSAGQSGGGIGAVDSSVNLKNVAISLNSATTTGGGLHAVNSELIVDDGVVVDSNQAATDGGGMYMRGSSARGGLAVVRKNTAQQRGGGLFGVGSVSLGGFSIQACTADEGAGMFLDTATATVTRLEVIDCPATTSGGGAFLKNSALTVVSSAIRRCSAVSGGGVRARGVSSINGDLQVTNCIASDKGGALYVRDTLTLSHVVVQASHAAHGGGIFTDGAIVSASNVTLEACVASVEGGGWAAQTSALTLKDVRLLGHHSATTGGGLALLESQVVHDNVNISDNAADGSGGGISMVNSTFAAVSVIPITSVVSVISKNVAQKDGGNVFLEGTGTIGSVRIAGGEAELSGGGVAMNQAVAVVRDCVVLENRAEQRGGGLSVHDRSACEIVDSIVSDNVALVTGGGVSVSHSIIRHGGLSLLRNAAPNGGGFVFDGIVKAIPVTADRVSIARANQAVSLAKVTGDGSAAYVAPTSNLEIAGFQIHEGVARRGAIFADAAKLHLHDCSFEQNSAAEGAALFANANSDVTVAHVNFTKNAASLSGGAVALTGDPLTGRVTARISNCTLTGNRAVKTGGAVALSDTDVTLANVRFTANSAASDDEGGGGAVAAISSAAFNATDCSFVNNTVLSTKTKGATFYLLKATTARLTNTSVVSDSDSAAVPREGGAVYITDKDSTLSIVDCEIANGTSYSGGAVYAAYASLSLVRTNIRNAQALEFGGGVYSDSGTVAIEDCTLSDNRAFYDGGAIYVRGETSLAVKRSHIRRSRVQDGGGGMFVAPGGGATVVVTNSTLQENANRGLGSAIFVGRKNTLTLTACALVDNGGAATEGGTLYAVDAQVDVGTTVFRNNSANRGAAIELSRNATLAMTASNMVDNHATVWGGALYMSVRSSAKIDNATIQGNTATTGGAVYLLGSAALTMRGSTVSSNRALSFGGAVTLVGRASADITTSTFLSNAAYTGGVVSITQNASLALAATSLGNNSARDFGGAIYIDTLTATSDRAIRLQGLDVRGNTALAGADIYWVFHPWFVLACDSCRALSAATAGALKIATSPIGITAGWWPTRVTSAVSLGITKPNWTEPGSSPPANTTASPGPSSVAPSPTPSQRRLDASSSMDASTIEAIAADPDQTSPSVGTLWPTLVVRDYYGAIADQDNRTQCLARKVATEKGKFEFYPSDAVVISRGYVTFGDAQVLADSRTEPFELYINCTLADDVQREWSVTIKVDNCDPGFENADGRCLRCKKGMYSLDGVKCHACPLGAICEGLDESKSPVGVSIPARAEGFFLHESRESFLGSNCLDPASWDAKDPCKNVEGAANMSMAYRLQRCSKADTFKDVWPPKRVFACLAELEYYACDTRDACVEEDAASVQLAQSVHELSQRKQCELGYGSVTCATCQNGFYKVSNGTCNPCSDPKDPNVAKITRLLAMVPLGFAFIAVLLVWYYFSNATESELMMQARAARKFQVYDPHAPPQSLLLATTFFIQQRVTDMMARARRSFVVRRRQRHLFHIAPRAVGSPPFRAEKFKIMLGFFQIFGGFKKVYEIPWPDEMSRLMDIFSIADFSLVDTTGIECFIHKDYFSNYRLSIIGVLTLLLLTTLLLSWGVVRYRVKLSGLPRHCVNCGLPVFKMLRRQPKTLVRRSTMVSMLRIQQKEHDLRMRRRSLVARAKDSAANKLESALSRTKNWWSTTRLGRLMNRFVVFTRLPASSSRHYPTCPTAQRIESEVLLMVVRSNLRLWRSRVRLRLNYQSFQNKCIKLFFWILLLFYPELSQRVVGMFYCDEIGTKHYMSRDKSRLCYEGEWLYYLPLTMLLIVVWVIGVPLLFWIIIFFKRRAGINDKLVLLDAPTHVQLKQRLLREMREDLVNRGIHVEPEKMKTFEKDLMADFLYGKRLSEPSMVAQVGFIYHSYRNEFWWFEVWDLGRKLCLNCVIGLLAKTGANRIIAGLIVFLIYLSVMLFFQPFKEQSDSTLAGITQIQLFVTLFCGLMLKMGAVHMQDHVILLLTYTAFISNVLTLTFAVFCIVYEKVDAARTARRRAREEHTRAIQTHVRKLWLKAYGWALTEVYLLDNSIRPMPFRVILELARRDREEKKLLDVDLQLARSLHADVGQLGEEDENVSASHIELELPRPG